MTENRTNPSDQGMVTAETTQEVQRVGGNAGGFTAAAVSTGTRPAEMGSQRDFTLAEAGSLEQVTDNSKLPKRIQEGITTRYPITDRNLDFEGEEGYPTPS